jgi:hypothetical protein
MPEKTVVSSGKQDEITRTDVDEGPRNCTRVAHSRIVVPAARNPGIRGCPRWGELFR